MENCQKLYEMGKQGGFNLLEYLTRSEATQAFSTALNDKLIQGLNPELPQAYDLVYDTVNINRKNITFPSIRGINPDLVPELAEFKFVDHALTSITVEPRKFGQRIGISRELLEDNEIGMIGWRTREAGRAHRELRRREHFKCLGYYSTGPAVCTGIVGTRNHGIFYPQNGYTNFISATAMNWEQRIARAMDQLLQQTITVGDQTIAFPVYADTIVANPSHQVAIQKVLNSVITVAGTGVGPVGAAIGADSNLAGTNIFRGKLPIQIYDPTIATAQAFVLQSKRGLASVRRTDLEIETYENKPFDGDELKSRERFLPAVIEERFICDIQITA